MTYLYCTINILCTLTANYVPYITFCACLIVGTYFFIPYICFHTFLFFVPKLYVVYVNALWILCMSSKYASIDNKADFLLRDADYRFAAALITQSLLISFVLCGTFRSYCILDSN